MLKNVHPSCISCLELGSSAQASNSASCMQQEHRDHSGQAGFSEANGVAAAELVEAAAEVVEPTGEVVEGRDAREDVLSDYGSNSSSDHSLCAPLPPQLQQPLEAPMDVDEGMGEAPAGNGAIGHSSTRDMLAPFQYSPSPLQDSPPFHRFS